MPLQTTLVGNLQPKLLSRQLRTDPYLTLYFLDSYTTNTSETTTTENVSLHSSKLQFEHNNLSDTITYRHCPRTILDDNLTPSQTGHSYKKQSKNSALPSRACWKSTPELLSHQHPQPPTSLSPPSIATPQIQAKKREQQTYLSTAPNFNSNTITYQQHYVSPLPQHHLNNNLKNPQPDRSCKKAI